MQNSQGNVLFLILIAVALFAVLSYAVTSSSRSGGAGPSEEAARTQASLIIQYGTTMRSAIMRMKISNGCNDNNLDFSNATHSSMTNNSNAPVNESCHLYKLNGGGLAPIRLTPKALESGTYSHVTRVTQMLGIGTDGASGLESANDLALFISGLNKQTCIAINNILNISNNGGNPPPMIYSGSAGSYSNGVLTSTMIRSSVPGQPAYCEWDSSGSGYRFIQTLIER